METWLIAFLQIVLINIILSGDNAIIIAMASRNLPAHQRKLAIFWGAFGAVALRVVLTLVAIKLLKIPFLSAVGGLLLVWVAFKLLIQKEEHESIDASDHLNKVVMTIIMADFIMSLDNVLAIAAIAQGDSLLIIIGLILSIPLVVWGSHLILHLLEKFPSLIYIGSAILAFTGAEMVISDPRLGTLIHEFSPILASAIPILLAFKVIIIGWLCQRVRVILF